MESRANTPQKQYQIKEQQPRTALFKIVVFLKAHTNKPFQVDRVTVGAAPLTY